jgi:3-oxoacyl-[acyl-carrier-protein] synthase II
VRRRVCVTGMGMVTCLGTGVRTNWEQLMAGHSGIRSITRFDTRDFITKIAGEVSDGFDPSGYVPVKELRRMDRYQQFALVAAGEAVQDSALSLPVEDPFRYGCVVGSGMGGLWTVEASSYGVHDKGPKSCHPLMIPKAVINLAPGMLSIKYGFKGLNCGVVNACASGTSAIGEACWALRNGRADVMLTGGAEAVVTPLSVGSFNALRALSIRNDAPQKASRPFDLDRDGFVIAEGAGMVVLESFEHAQNRGAKIYCEIVGYGATDDAYHIVMPDPNGEGAYQAMRSALDEAGVPPSEIGYINAHGTSTELNDKMETAAIKRLFRDAAHKVAISSTKSMTGHLIGAAGAVEAIFSIMALNAGMLPPTINLDNPDPECDLDYTPNKAAKKDLAYALSNSFAFGGQNASLVFKRV